MMDPADVPAEHARRVAREIALFEERQEIHSYGAAFAFHDRHAVRPLLGRVFGREDLYEILAERLAAAATRTGTDLVISLGCGEGLQEQQILSAADRLRLAPFRIIGLDLAPGVVERANLLAMKAGLGGRFEALVHDLNAGLPDHAPLAGVLAFQTLHHLVALEALMEAIDARLHPEGSFVVADMIGRNGHMRWPEVRPLIQRLWAMLPAGKCWDHGLSRPARFFQDWDCSVDGFEGVRAQEILGLVSTRFRVARLAAWGGITESFLNIRMGPNLDPDDPADRLFLERLAALEARLLAERKTTPTIVLADYRSLRGSFQSDEVARSAERLALRQPDEAFAELSGEPFLSPYPAQPSPVLPVLETGRRHVPSEGAPLLDSLRVGWEPLDAGVVWALLDEQSLAFRTEAPVHEIVIEVWTKTPRARAPEFRATARGCPPVSTGALASPTLARLVLRAEQPQAEWFVHITANTYHRWDEDGGDDFRPLAYALSAVEVAPAVATRVTSRRDARSRPGPERSRPQAGAPRRAAVSAKAASSPACIAAGEKRAAT